MRILQIPSWPVLTAIGALALSGAACTEPKIAHAPPVPALAPPSATDAKAVDLPGLHNVVTYADGLVGGAVPEGEQGFRTLAQLGIRTVISVDGATPDTELAGRHGMRYVHLPIGYDGVPTARAQELAQAIASLPGPVYLHCHHGKHRSAAGLGVACVVAGRLTPEQALDRMKASGTAANYRGLWASVQGARPADPQTLRADPARFPAVAKVSGLVAAMTELDVANDQAKALQANGWQPPAEHPDLVPLQVATRMHELLASLQHDEESQRLDAGYQKLLTKAIDLAATLATAVRSGDQATARQTFDALGKACKECHQPYRDQ